MRRLGSCLISLSALVLLVALAPQAAADHTNPRAQLAPTEGTPDEGLPFGAGTWRHIKNFHGGANNALTGGGTDLEFFRPAVVDDVFGSFGTLGQDNAGSIGQRILRLTVNGRVKPHWIADHGSAHCETNNSSVTGLQHDVQIGRVGKVRLLTDTTDALGRCHDTGGGGIEIVDVTHAAKKAWAPREVHLVRFAGYSHTNTIDRQRPWLVYNSSSDFANRNWIDVMNMRSCYTKGKLDKRRAECRPEVHRIPFRDAWTQQRDQTTGELEPGSATCHDITYAKSRLYCAALNATLILDVSDLVNRKGNVKGDPLPCTVVPGTRTTAKVTDCSQTDESTQRARGWRFLGTFQHPGRDCQPLGDTRNCNSNNFVPSDQGVAVSHEADPTPNEQLMFVTDERGGGIVPPGASCGPGIENPIGNGGIHAFDISDPSNIEYATTPTGAKAVFIGEAHVPDPTFCDVHVIEQVPGEQRLIVAYYSQGIKIVDYFVDSRGRVQFRETASYVLPDANTWVAEDFKIRDNPNGSRTYFIATNDIHRGIDIVSWTARPNPMGATPPAANSTTVTNTALVGISAAALLGAAAYRRRRFSGSPAVKTSIPPAARA